MRTEWDTDLDAALVMERWLDGLYLLSIDKRTSSADPIDPIVPAARWLWHELRERADKREKLRAVLERNPDLAPRAALSWREMRAP